MVLLIKTTAIPASLTGYLSRYLLELESGLFAGTVSRRLADHLWRQVERYSAEGHAVGVFSGGNELGFTLRTHNHPTLDIRDFDGLPLPVIKPGQTS
ncbi:MAG: type I-E CRISPR-associated endoribonuclease Cas2e [Microthrixaceae bacterium]